MKLKNPPVEFRLVKKEIYETSFIAFSQRI
jgi:hypothetical protein